MSNKQSRRARRLRSRIGQVVLLLAIYYLVPIRETTSVPDQVMRGAFALLVSRDLISFT